MSVLLLIRHGQASFGAKDYDVLSPLGVEQAEHLGAHLADRGPKLDAIYSGPAQRQRHSADHLRRVADERGQPLPEVAIIPELDEYPAFELFRQFLPQLRSDFPEIMEMTEKDNVSAPARRAFRKMSESWAHGKLDSGDLETFADFETRVLRGLDRIMSEQGRGKTVAVTTSGGPISIAMRRALRLDPAITLRSAEVVANASISEFRFRENEFNLVAFNRVPHLVNERLITYR